MENVAYRSPAHPVMITAINGVSTAGENVVTTLTEGEIRYDGEFEKNGKTVIESLLGEKLRTFNAGQNETVGDSLVVRSVNGEDITVDGKFESRDSGEYPLVVKSGNKVKNYIVRIIDGGESKTLISPSVGYENYTVVKSSAMIDSKTGLLISNEKVRPWSNYPSWSVGLKGVMSGDLSIEYLLEHKNYVGVPSFVIKDIEGNEKIRIGRLFYGTINGKDNGAVIVKDCANDKYYTIDENGNGKIDVTDKLVSSDGRKPFFQTTTIIPQSKVLPQFGGNEAGKLMLEFDGDTVNVKLTVKDKGELICASVNADSIKNGYTLTVEDWRTVRDASAEQGKQGSYRDAGVGVMLTDINGMDLSGKFFKYDHTEVSSFNYEGRVIDGKIAVVAGRYDSLGQVRYQGKKYFSKGWSVDLDEIVQGCSLTGNGFDFFIGGEYDGVDISVSGAVVWKGVTVKVYNSYVVYFDANSGVSVTEKYFSELEDTSLPNAAKGEGWLFDGWYDGDVKIENLTADLDGKTLKAKWRNAPPFITLENGVQPYTMIQRGDEFAVSKSDISAADYFDGNIPADKITVEIKKPGANEYVSLGEFTFNADLYGEYQIRYSATDSAGETAHLIRTVKYVKAFIAISINGEVPAKGCVGYTVVIPSATAAYDNQRIDCVVSVTFNGATI
ncbi:MAG: hypothetical protein SO003_06140, partial [Candidatus Borkfalkiaceae bacterium]|nr:hypothetical protein [Christensenellaceae bacterium]